MEAPSSRLKGLNSLTHADVSERTWHYTTTIDVTSTYSYLVTQTISATQWETETSALNAKTTVYATTAVNLAKLATVSDVSQSTSTIARKGAPSRGGGRGLRKGAKGGIGAGARGGFLIICFILTIFIRQQRRKKKVE